MGTTPGPLVRAFPPFVLTIPLVVSVDCGLDFFLKRVEPNCNVVTFVVFVPIGVESKGGRLIEMFRRSKS